MIHNSSQPGKSWWRKEDAQDLMTSDINTEALVPEPTAHLVCSQDEEVGDHNPEDLRRLPVQSKVQRR